MKTQEVSLKFISYSNMIYRSLLLALLLSLFSIEKGKCQYSGQDYFNFSYSASEQHNNDSAMYYLSRAIAIDTTMSNAYYNRGVLRLSNQDLLGAIDDFSKCLTMDIGHGQAYNNRGYIYIMIGMKEKGCKDLRVGRDLGIEQSKGNFQMYCSDYKEH